MRPLPPGGTGDPDEAASPGEPATTSESESERTSTSTDEAFAWGTATETPAASRLPGAARYIAGRLGQGVLVLFGAVTVSFGLVHLTGNPATVLGGTSLPKEAVEALSTELGYDRPLLSQYGSFLWNVLQGDFGQSVSYGSPALDNAMAALPKTLLLVGISLGVAITVSSVIAVWSVISPRGAGDRLWRPVLMALQGIPDFWIALVLVFVMSVKLNLLPSLGFTGVRSLVMPCAALTLPIMASFTRLLRGKLLDFMRSDTAFALQARGLTRREIVIHHAARNAMTTFVSYAGLQAGWLLGGTLIVETIFSWPGIGSLLYSAVQARDLTVIQAIVVIIALAFVVLNLLADLVVLWLDPRIGRTALGESS